MSGYYRLYFMERPGGHIGHSREYEAADDQSALAQAEGWRETCPMELWCDARKVKRWDAFGVNLQPAHLTLVQGRPLQ